MIQATENLLGFTTDGLILVTADNHQIGIYDAQTGQPLCKPIDFEIGTNSQTLPVLVAGRQLVIPNGPEILSLDLHPDPHPQTISSSSANS